MSHGIALIGAGRWGEKLLRVLYQRGVLKRIYVRSPEKYESLRRTYPGVCWSSDLTEIWEDPGCRAVAIATPAPTHPELIERALRAGKDVFCEKPLAFSVAQVRYLADLAAEKGLLLMGGHILHYHPAVEVIQSFLAEGRIGRLLTFHAERTGLGRFPLTEDALWGLAIHDLGLLSYLLGTQPIEAKAHAQASTATVQADTVWIHLKYASGLQGEILASWTFPERRRRLTLIGTEGMLTFSEESEKPVLNYHAHRFIWHNGQDPHLKPADTVETIPVPATEPLAAEIDAFLQAIETRQEPRTSARALEPVIALAEKLHRQLFPEAEGSRDYFVHPTALVDENVEIGEGTKIWHFSHILRGSRIGKNCVLGQNVVVGPFVRVGNNCKIQNNVSLYYGVELEDGVLCGPSCVFTNDKYPRAFIERRNEFLQTRVRQGATLGANATIMCGTTIGRFAMVGAGAVVLHDVPDHALVVGNPARQVGWVCECGETLRELKPDELYYCDRCDLTYERTLKGLQKSTAPIS